MSYQLWEHVKDSDLTLTDHTDAAEEGRALDPLLKTSMSLIPSTVINELIDKRNYAISEFEPCADRKGQGRFAIRCECIIRNTFASHILTLRSPDRGPMDRAGYLRG